MTDSIDRLENILYHMIPQNSTLSNSSEAVTSLGCLYVCLGMDTAALIQIYSSDLPTISPNSLLFKLYKHVGKIDLCSVSTIVYRKNQCPLLIQDWSCTVASGNIHGIYAWLTAGLGFIHPKLRFRNPYLGFSNPHLGISSSMTKLR